MSNIRFCAFADEASPSLDLQIKALQRNSLSLLEIRGVDGKNISALSLEETKETKKRLSDAGIFVWSIGSPIGKCDIHEDFSIETERFKKTLETANMLEAENMRIFSFYKTTEADINEVVDRLGAFLDIAKGSGVDLCHENEKGIFGDTYEKCLMLHKALPNLPAVFDPANFVQCESDTKDAWNAISSYVKYLHAKDANGKRVVPCGVGDGNVKYVFDEFVKKGGGVITVEPHLKSFVGLSALEAEGDEGAVGGMSFSSSDEAFDYAVSTAKKLII